MSEYVSYADAAFVAIKMVEGMNPKAFYDEIPSKKGPSFMLNYKGMSLLGGIMGVNVTLLEETEESDETQVVMKATARDPQDNKGYAWLSRPKKGYQDKEDEDWREKVYTHAKRNAMRDLVPYQLFLELLMLKANGKDVPTANPVQKPKTETILEQSISAARGIAVQRLNEFLEEGGSKEEFAILREEATALTEEKFKAKQEDWTPSQWIEFGKVLAAIEFTEPEEENITGEPEVKENDNDLEPVDKPEESEEELEEIELLAGAEGEGDEEEEEDSEASEEADNANQLQMLLEEVDTTGKKK